MTAVTSLAELRESGQGVVYRASSLLFGGILSPYPCKVIFPSGEWALFGRHALDTAKDVYWMHDSDRARPCVSCGSFVQSAGQVCIVTGGEHRNAQVMNLNLSWVPGLQEKAQSLGLEQFNSYARGPVTIGNGVVVSKHASIRSGVTIGDGAVIGMGAVVVKDVPPYAIVAGNPARVIRMRFCDSEIEALTRTRWWDLKTGILHRHLETFYGDTPGLLSFLSGLRGDDYWQPEGTMVLSAARNTETSFTLRFQGAEVAGEFTPAHALPPLFIDYIKQARSAPGEAVVITEKIFTLSDLI